MKCKLTNSYLENKNQGGFMWKLKVFIKLRHANLEICLLYFLSYALKMRLFEGIYTLVHSALVKKLQNKRVV